MEKIAIIFDYFKEAFRLNKVNKDLYKPQLVFIAIKTAMFVLLFMSIYGLIEKISYVDSIDEVIGWSILGLAGKMFALLLFMFIVAVIFEAGIFNMYKEVVINRTLKDGAFKEGVSKYLIKVFLVDMLTIIFWLVISVPYALIGALTLSAGFVIIPIIIGIFTTMWKVSIIMDEIGVFDGLKASISFAKVNFWPLTAMVVIQNAFINISSGGSYGKSSSSNSLNWKMNENENNPIVKKLESLDNYGFDFQAALSQALPTIKSVFLIAVPVVSIAFIVFSIIRMIFTVFFSLSLFIMYDDKTKKIGLESPEEVL